jgi:hypothetical protein
MTNKEIRKVMKYKKDIICNTSLSTASNARKEFKREYEPMKKANSKGKLSKKNESIDNNRYTCGRSFTIALVHFFFT